MSVASPGSVDILLAALPWHLPNHLSLQISGLKSFLVSKGWGAVARHYYKDVAGYLADEQLACIQRRLMGEFLFGALYFPERADLVVEQVAARLAPHDPKEILRSLNQYVDDVVADIVGLQPAVMGLTTTHMQLMASLLIARRVREKIPNTRVVLGGLALAGPLAHALVQNHPEIDFVVEGEGELALHSLLESVVKRTLTLPDVPQLIYRDELGNVRYNEPSGVLPLDDLPLPDYSDSYQHSVGDSSCTITHPHISIEASRGCGWGKCTFCIEGLPSRRAYRRKSPQRVMSEVSTLAERWKTTSFLFTDPDTAYLSRVFALLRELPIDLKLEAEVSGLVTRNTLRDMRASGLDDIQIGIETFSAKVNKVLNKGVPIVKYVELMKMCDELGIHLTYNLIVETPWEVQADVDEAVRNMRRLFYFQAPRLCPFRVSYGSAVYQDPAQFNIAKLRPSPQLAWMPERFRESLGVLISNHAGFEFDRIEERSVDYTEFNRTVQDWREARELGTSLRGRIGPGFVVLTIQAGDLIRTVQLDGVEADVYLFCASTSRTLAAVMRAFPALREEELREILGRFNEAGLAFTDADRYLALAIFREDRLLAHNRRFEKSQGLPIVQATET